MFRNDKIKVVRAGKAVTPYQLVDGVIGTAIDLRMGTGAFAGVWDRFPKAWKDREEGVRGNMTKKEISDFLHRSWTILLQGNKEEEEEVRLPTMLIGALMAYLWSVWMVRWAKEQ